MYVRTRNIIIAYNNKDKLQLKRNMSKYSLVKEGEFMNQFRKQGISFLSTLDENKLANIVVNANNAFHQDKTPFMTDNEYDIIKEYIEEKYPDSSVLTLIGSNVIQKNKTKLPYEMASMDKIKPDTNIIISWKQKYTGPYVISSKLDGVSGLFSTEGIAPKLYTRGDGLFGQDVSHLIPYLSLPTHLKNIVVRGEFIIPKKVFNEKYASTFANARNLVAGMVNRLSVNVDMVKHLQFVAYEVIAPVLKPSEQFSFLNDNMFKTAYNEIVGLNLSNQFLSDKLVQLREQYTYEIDGIIVTNDTIVPRISGNPKHSFAFKMVLSEQIAEAKVLDVLWSASKDGYLKPRVQIEPVKLGGVTIEYATGFNGAFIQNNRIGLGAIIELIRSGDVIPYIRRVTTPSIEPKMPNVPYKWTDSQVDILLENIDSDLTVKEKLISGFFKGISVDGLGAGNVSRLIDAGFDSIPKIINMSISDFLTVDGFKKTLSTKIHNNIHERLHTTSLANIMASSNIFGRGFSDKKMDLILDELPDILQPSLSSDVKTMMVAKIKGMSTKTASSFVENIPKFNDFLKNIHYYKNNNQISSTVDHNINNGTTGCEKKCVDHPLYKKIIVMTGTRDASVIDAIKKTGAVIGTSVSKNTFVVITNDPTDNTTKLLNARKLNISIITPEVFLTTYV
jgi:DNA ligase (NAD+)